VKAEYGELASTSTTSSTADDGSAEAMDIFATVRCRAWPSGIKEIHALVLSLQEFSVVIGGALMCLVQHESCPPASMKLWSAMNLLLSLLAIE
jgi:hypothetical protein